MSKIDEAELTNLAWRLAYKKFDELPHSDKFEVYRIIAIQRQTDAITAQTNAIEKLLSHLMESGPARR